ncbi:hypothetical protein BO78DRAFT_337797 [Aspergillus sclerotiicarbonarius CBS 121057]|uniref:CENP-V/GFA domain-containing protein n=1 Tax=Aspergillus sclerotiicarbonarius (strain CBS 121057 / IBT 28362) TaxID=1448318 RepID=A0A319EHK5_ASPSB|nr:hypothetical protein BO78DRAFT_337797 [Aspergillus sclerotiicarbonarius CBS 121057]
MSYNPQPPPTNESSVHKANCHCGAVRFTVTLSPPLHEYPVMNCNCSICSRNGYLLVYPNTKDFTLEKGEEVLKDHRFNSRQVRHRFCGQCGSSCFVQLPDPAPFVCVNVRMFEEIDLDKLKLRKEDGRSWKGEYKPEFN